MTTQNHARIRGEITAVEAVVGGAILTAMPYHQVETGRGLGSRLELNDACPMLLFMPTPAWDEDAGTVYHATSQIGRPSQILFEDDASVPTGRRCEKVVNRLWNAN